MASKSFKVSFTLDESDAAYFRRLYRTAKQHSSPEDRPKILKEVGGLIDRVRASKKAPGFVLETILVLEDLIPRFDAARCDAVFFVQVFVHSVIGVGSDGQCLGQTTADGDHMVIELLMLARKSQ